MLFSIVEAPVYIPTNRAQGLLFFTTSPILVISYLFEDSISTRRVVIYHCGFGFNLHD